MSVDALFDVVIAGERLFALSGPLRALSAQVDAVRNVAPDLGPELDAIDGRIAEAIDHVLAAQDVLKARLALLKGAS